MKNLFLLCREISAYSYDTPMLLGIFTQKNLAEQAKQQYLNQMANYDPFHSQAYFDVDFSKNLQIYEIDESFQKFLTNIDCETVYLVKATEEGFGQAYIEYVAIFEVEKHAQDFADVMNDKQDELVDSFPKYFEYETLPLNQRLNEFMRSNQLAESLYFDEINQPTPKIFCHHLLLTDDLKQLLGEAYESDNAFLTPTKKHLILKNPQKEFARFKMVDWFSWDNRQAQRQALLDTGYCLFIVFYQSLESFEIETWLELSDDELKQHYMSQNAEQPVFEIFVFNVL